MESLNEFLDNASQNLKPEEKALLESSLHSLKSAYPFNEYEYRISYLLAKKAITFEQYCEIRSSYLDRNRYLHVFEMSASLFGGWAERVFKNIVPLAKKPTKETDPVQYKYYDFIYGKIKIELKAARVVKKDSKDPLPLKALSKNSGDNFDIIFEQIKPDFCDVFILMAVWRDDIRFWFLTSDEMERLYSEKQHAGNQGEGQMHLKKSNITEFDKYSIPLKSIWPELDEKARNKTDKKE